MTSMTSRRAFLAGTITAVAIPVAANAQQPPRVPRVGLLLTPSPEHPIAQATLAAFRQGLYERGYVEGQTIAIEARFAPEILDRYRALVAELASLKVDVIVVGSTRMAVAAKQVTTTTPIVAAVMADPVKDGLVASLGHPGGNITGLTFFAPALVAKRVQLLREAVPGAPHVAVLSHAGVYSEHTMKDMLEEAEVAAKTLGVSLQLLQVKDPNEIDRAFSAMATGGARALIVFPSPMFYAEHRRIVDLATKYRLPAIYAFREAVDSGGLMSYGTNIPDLLRLAATFVDKILKGAKPADLPVEQPTKFEFVINLKTAKALGLMIPSAVLARADELIQ
jgi:putative tryptophan/tyrosine transport system substrate-binding protein